MITNEIELSRIFLKLATFYTKELDEEGLMDYLDIFKDYDIRYVYQAVRRHKIDTENGMFFPKPAHLIKYIDILHNKPLAPYHREFPKIKPIRSSKETASKYLKEIRDILK